MRIENAQNKGKRRVESHRNSLSYFEKTNIKIIRMPLGLPRGFFTSGICPSS